MAKFVTFERPAHLNRAFDSRLVAVNVDHISQFFNAFKGPKDDQEWSHGVIQLSNGLCIEVDAVHEQFEAAIERAMKLEAATISCMGDSPTK